MVGLWRADFHLFEVASTGITTLCCTCGMLFLTSPARGHESLTTSDVCHALLKPLTAADGWECIPFLTDAEKRWYRHDYRSHATGETIHCGFGQPGVPPPGSRSYCEVCAPPP